MPLTSRSRVVRLVAANLAVLVVGLVALEVGFGHWFRPNRMARLNIPSDVVRYSDVSTLYPTADPVIRYTRDGHGFRGPYRTVGSIDILTIGGSTTDQRYIADGHTWQDALARRFAEDGRPVSVVNAGIDGQSTYGHIKNFEWWFPFVPGLRVRYVLFYVGLNDFYKDDDYARDRLLRPSSRIRALLEQNSALYQLYRTLRGMYDAVVVADLGHRGIRLSTLAWTPLPQLHDHAGLVRRRVDAYRQRLLTLGQRVRQLGARPICVTQPSRAYKKVGGAILGVATLGHYDGALMNGVDYYHMIQQFHRTTLETCREMDGLAIDLANEVEWDDQDFYDFAHNTPRGAEKIGRALYAALRRHEPVHRALTSQASGGAPASAGGLR